MPMRRATSSTSVEKTRPRVLVAGVSTRALVESAARAGYAVVSVDAFGDMDNLAVPSQSLVRDLNVTYSADAAARASRDLDCQAVCYVSDLENYPSSVELLSRGRALWGNTPDVLARARDPLGLARLLRATRRPAARVRARALRTESSTEWLAKPRASGGGHGITEWHPGDQLPRSHVLQERIAGVPGSIVFVADGRNAVPFALSRQLVGDPAFGATGFQYCGSILSGTRHAVHGSASCDADHAALAALLEAAAESARALTGELALVGVNCLDFIAQAGVPHVIELNPRYSASMELAERAFDFSVFEAHVRACGGVRDGSDGSGESSDGRSHNPGGGGSGCENAGTLMGSGSVRELPDFDLAHSLRHVDAVGKAVLYARHTTTVGDTRPWLEDPDVRDVPHPGETILRGHPVCTIFAAGRDDVECYAALVRAARGRYDTIERKDSGFRVQGTEGGVSE